jgi:hypothetical protein
VDSEWDPIDQKLKYVSAFLQHTTIARSPFYERGFFHFEIGPGGYQNIPECSDYFQSGGTFRKKCTEKTVVQIFLQM